MVFGDLAILLTGGASVGGFWPWVFGEKVRKCYEIRVFCAICEKKLVFYLLF